LRASRGRKQPTRDTDWEQDDALTPASAGRLIGGAQPVTDSGFGENVMRALGIGLDLLPKLPDIDAQILRVSEIAPQLAQQEFVPVTGSPLYCCKRRIASTAIT